ncbi:hypothetical protein HanIR_Chr05g0233581 [Helianthus annuus]|nr:hypothetical protein HanIR_Chr05g0233581 [Helianthus annuus]
MVTIERKSVASPNNSFLGNDSKKSRSAYRDVRIAKNMRIEVDEDIKETASAITKIMRAGSLRKKGIPVSWLYPPGTVKAAAKTIVVMRVATTMHSDAVCFIQSSPLFTNFSCFLVNKSRGVILSPFFLCLY